MKYFAFLIFGILIGLSFPCTTYALSTEQSSSLTNQNADNLKDPDDQVPGFISVPPNDPTASGHFAFGPSPTNAPNVQSLDGGTLAFDRAFAHQQTPQ